MTRSPLHSLWLMPEPAWAAEFSAVNRELAAEFGAPEFEPHLTLLGGTARDPAWLAATLVALSRGIPAFERPIADVRVGESRFRSFYAWFEPAGQLAELRRRAGVGLHASGEMLEPFLPHVSLLYGPVEPAAKAAARARVHRRLAGRNVGFDRICIALSGDTVPIDEWKIVDQVRLA